MHLIMNGVNGRYLRDILEQAEGVTERVDAAVAYTTDGDLLFEWCWQRNIPLRYWARFDESVPVSIPVLEKFLRRNSGRFSCRFIRCFHTKVIWWRGFGAYIGSANLTQPAWWNNFEAGIFLTENELESSEHGSELESLFEDINRRSSPLNDELFALMQARSQQIQRQKTQDADARQFSGTDLVTPWEGLGYQSRATAEQRKRTEFIDEWNSTLQIMRGIAELASREDYRPSWVYSDAPLGVQADQFLHAHYYQNTFDGRRANYETHFEENKSDPDKAAENAMRWWAALPEAPNSEDRTLNEWAPFLRKSLAPERIMDLSADDFVEVLSRIYAVREYARRVSNKIIGLPSTRDYSIDEKVTALAQHIYANPSRGGPTPLETINFVLYGGTPDHVADRLWSSLRDPRLTIENFGISALGEIVGWALPDRFPPRNGRTSKALRSLGYDVKIHV